MSVKDDMPLVEEFLGSYGPTSIGRVAAMLDMSCRRVYAVALANPDTFDVVGIVGGIKTWCIGLAGEVPVHFSI